MTIVVTGQLDLSHDARKVEKIQPRSGGAISYTITGGQYVPSAEAWDGWPHYRWDVRFRNNRTGKTLTIAYRMGTGLTGAPDPIDVLESSFRDAEYVEFDSFESFAADMGYDLESDYSRARRIYNACERMGERLERFFAPEKITWHGAIIRTAEGEF